MKRQKKNIQSQSGFTLVEVMVTMVIIGLLATVVVLNVLPAQDKAMSQKAVADIRLLSQAVEMYRLDLRQYPENLEDLRTQPAGVADGRYRKGGYVQFLPQDPWGNAYLYAYPGANSAFDVWSLGADGVEGGEGSDADISNWRE